MYLFLALIYDLISVRVILCSCLLLSICTVFMNTLYLTDYLYLLFYYISTHGYVTTYINVSRPYPPPPPPTRDRLSGTPHTQTLHTNPTHIRYDTNRN